MARLRMVVDGNENSGTSSGNGVDSEDGPATRPQRQKYVFF
jgi:hypothetical protein